MKRLSSTRKLILLLILGGVAVVFATCSPGYVIRAGIEEAKILSRRRPIADVIADPGTSPEIRAKLRLVTQARAFAEGQLGLAANESYTTYSWVDSDTLLMVVSAARKDKFEPYLWWFPIVGHVPYKGYFDFERAYSEARDLEQKGYDTNVRPSGAFSTLGWFNDPLLNTILRYDDVSLVETVVHEILHNSIYLSGQAGFNESLANFVGDRGSIMFFCAREGPGEKRCKDADTLWHDNLVFGAALSDLVAKLEGVYNNGSYTTEEKLAQREVVFKEWAAHYRTEVVPQLQWAFKRYADSPLNNARLIGTRLYYQHLDLFEQVYQKYQANLPATIRAIIAAAKQSGDHPFEAVQQLLR